MIKNLLQKVANYLFTSLLLFVSLLFTTHSFADTKTDVDALEAFYQQAFNKQTPTKKTRKSLRAKKTKKTTGRADARSTFDNQKKANYKDPELVPFYANVFGKSANKTAAHDIPSKKKSYKVIANDLIPMVQKVTVTSILKPVSPTKDKSETSVLFNKASNKKLNSKTNRALVSKQHTNSRSMAALFAKAFGKNTSLSVPSKITVDLRINSSVFGEIELYSNSSGTIDLVDTKTLIELLEDILKDHVHSKVIQELSNDQKTTFDRLNNLDIIAYYNSTNLSLDLEIKPELRKPQKLSLLRKKKASVRKENKIEAQKISGFLNAFTTVGLNSASDNTDLRMRLEGSLNIVGAVLETSSDYRNEKIDFGRTTLIYDRPEKLQRFTLGNISTSSRNFQENLLLDGLRISKEFFLDPDLQISPKANESLQLDSDSEVELYINNRLIRRFYLKAGVYALQDIGLYNGANNIRIRIKDEFGKITLKTSQQYYDSQLIKPGLSLYAMSMGYLSNQQTNSNNSLRKTPIFSAYYQKGISKELTLNLDAQLSKDYYLVGAETISSINLGTIKNSLAVSGGKKRKSGFATSFEFSPSNEQKQISLDTLREDLLGLDTHSKGLLSNWSVTGEYRSEDFSTLSNPDPDLIEVSQENGDITFANRVFNNNKFKGNLQTNLSLNINDKWQGYMNVGVADYYDSKTSYYANLSTTRSFDNGMRLSLGTRYDTEDEVSMNLQLSIPLSRKKNKKRVNLDILADSRYNAYESKLKVSPTSLVGKNSLAGSLEHFANQDSHQQELNLQYRNPQFETKFTARNRYFKASREKSQQLNLSFNTAIACVGSSCATSYPIADSFALVSGPSNQQAPIAINNGANRFRYSEDNDTGLPDNYTALIQKKGDKAVVPLNSYRFQNINIDESTLPDGYNIEKTEFEVFSKYHQGFMIKAGGEPATILDGVLVNQANKPLGFKGGQWKAIPDNYTTKKPNAVESNAKNIAFFSNKAGRFRVTSVPAGKYKLELFDYPDLKPVTISVPDLKGKIHNLGDLVIRE